MSNICAGLTGDAPAIALRLFLGSQPQLVIEKRMIQQMQSVYPWLTSRKRLKESANDYFELDGGSCDPEILLRYSHIEFSRSQLHKDAMEKQKNMLEGGKLPPEASPRILDCLRECHFLLKERLAFEEKQLAAAKRRAKIPFRREIEPTSPLVPGDYLCMMRCVEEDQSEIDRLEMRCKTFLTVPAVSEALSELTKTLLPAELKKPGLDKKATKALRRQLLPDYDKVGHVPKLRPTDVTAQYRFVGQNLVQTNDFFQQSLWGNLFRRYALHPSYFQGLSSYWAFHSGEGLKIKAPMKHVPLDWAVNATKVQELFPALRFQFQYQYCSSDFVRQQWFTEPYVPLIRLFPLLGKHCAEDLLASTLVDNFWKKSLRVDTQDNIMESKFINEAKNFVAEMSNLYENNQDQLLEQVKEGMEWIAPPLTSEEQKLSLLPLEEEAVKDVDEESLEYIVEYVLEGHSETQPLPNEEAIKAES